jgi:peptide/nickel transport system permease protein
MTADSDQAAIGTAVTPSPERPWRRFLSDFVENKVAVGALVFFIMTFLLAVLAPWISPQNPFDLIQINIMENRLPPGTPAMDGYIYWLGTDDQGRDMLSAIFYGLRISLFVGGTSIVISLVLGAFFGLVAAYFGGRVDSLIMRLVDIQLSFPAILVAVILISIMGRGVDKVIIAIVVAKWAYFARTIRSTAMVECNKEYIDAAIGLAISRLRVISLHLLPNSVAPLIVVAAIQTAHAISLEATLSFLGIGLPITQPSLGLLIANGFEYMLSGKYWISVFPGLALMVAIVSINIVGDHLRDVLNPRRQR